jgi:hypothetical protein
LSASKIAFMPALALQTEIARPEKKASPGLAGNALHLLADDVDRATGHQPCERCQMIVDRPRIGEQAVERDERGDGREQGEQRVERHPGSHREDAVAADLLVDAPSDIHPSLGRNFGRRIRLASALVFPGLGPAPLRRVPTVGVCVAPRRPIRRAALGWPAVQEAAQHEGEREGPDARQRGWSGARLGGVGRGVRHGVRRWRLRLAEAQRRPPRPVPAAFPSGPEVRSATLGYQRRQWWRCHGRPQ